MGRVTPCILKDEIKNDDKAIIPTNDEGVHISSPQGPRPNHMIMVVKVLEWGFLVENLFHYQQRIIRNL